MKTSRFERLSIFQVHSRSFSSSTSTYHSWKPRSSIKSTSVESSAPGFHSTATRDDSKTKKKSVEGSSEFAQQQSESFDFPLLNNSVPQQSQSDVARNPTTNVISNQSTSNGGPSTNNHNLLGHSPITNIVRKSSPLYGDPSTSYRNCVTTPPSNSNVSPHNNRQHIVHTLNNRPVEFSCSSNRSSIIWFWATSPPSSSVSSFQSSCSPTSFFRILSI